MYINQEFKKFISQQEISDSTEISGLVKQIKDFYKNFNDKIERYTSRYRTAVEAILNQFPINQIIYLEYYRKGKMISKNKISYKSICISCPKS